MTRSKDDYHGTLECFIYVLICHMPDFHVLQLHNKLQKIELEYFYLMICFCFLYLYLFDLIGFYVTPTQYRSYGKVPALQVPFRALFLAKNGHLSITTIRICIKKNKTVY
jgi:hypothetical protein